MKPFTKKRLGGGILASVRVMSSLLYPLIPVPLIFEKQPSLSNGEPLCSLLRSYSHWAVGHVTLIWLNLYAPALWSQGLVQGLAHNQHQTKGHQS